MDYNVLIDVLGALTVLVLLISIKKSAPDISARDRMLRVLLLGCLSVLLADIPGLLLDGLRFPGARALLWCLDSGYWLLHIRFCWLWTRFTLMWCFPDRKLEGWVLRLWALPLLCGATLALANPWTGWLFVLDDANVYSPGSAYQLCLIPNYIYLASSLFMVFIGFVRQRDPELKRRCLSMLAYMLLPVCGIAMELFASSVSWLWPMVALSLLMLYLDLQQKDILEERLSAARAAESVARMQAETAAGRVSIMLSQIQPHFLYNALCVIQDLCHDKAPEAEQATIAFSRFLRGNLDSLNARGPIPFEQELGHTRYYLTLEQMRFGSRLRVEYDIAAEDFSLPAMTLQPIVENAVRYGVTKRESGGTVRISAEATQSKYLVTVEDDGVGFDTNQKHEDGRTHVGIENVRQRLRELCGGDLEIRSMPGAGTIATIILPRGAESGEDTGRG